MKRARWFAAAIAIALGGRALLRRARAFPMRVSGPSMLPALAPGDLIAVARVPPGGPRLGDVIVVREASGIEAVKRVARVLGPGEYWVEGDNQAASTDSRAYGPVGREQIVGVVRALYWPPGRARVFTSRR